MRLLYVVVTVRDDAALTRLRAAAARPWLVMYKGAVRFWVPSLADAVRERAALALAGFTSRIEGIDPSA